MDAITLINEKLNVLKLLEYYQFDINEQSGLIRSRCKIHDGDNPSAFAINSTTGLWYCFTGGCGGGDAFTLVQQLEGLDFKEAVKWLGDFVDIDLTNLEIKERKSSYMDDINSFIKLMKSNKKQELKPFTINAETKKVTAFRNFNLETLEYFNLQYVKSIELINKNDQPYTLFNRLLFPITFNDIQVGISLRRINKNDQPKWLHQPTHIQTNQLLYNYDNTRYNSTLVICEGITDVWTFHELNIPAVATFGAHLSHEQYKLILKSGAEKVVLAYDNDDAGNYAVKKAFKKLRNKVKLFYLPLDENQDPESVSRGELLTKYGKSKSI